MNNWLELFLKSDMGKVAQTIYDELCPPVAGRNNNRIRVYRMPNNEVVIHYRDLKINLLTVEEQEEWRCGFAEALKKLEEGQYFLNDI